MSDTDLYKTLANKETWSIEEVLKLLCGPSDPSAIIRGETHRPMGELLETAANQGRFGKATVYMEPGSGYTPCWDILYLAEINDGHFVNENLDLILDLPVHPLRVIEWIDDVFEYDETFHSLSIESKTFTLNLQLFTILQEWRTRRDQGEIKDPVADVSFEKLVKADLWLRTEIHVALFGETYSKRYPSFIYHHYKPKLEEHLRTVDTYIEGALATEKLKKYPHQGAKSLLIENHGFDEYYEYKDDYQGIDIYTKNELKGRKGITPKDALEVLKFKGYPVPNDLTKAINNGKWENAEKLLKRLREGFLYFVEHGELPSVDIEASKKEKEFFPAPNDTEWSEVHFRLTEELQITIRIKNKEQLFSMTRLAKKFPRKPSRNLLFRIIRVGGVFDKSILDKKNEAHLKQYVSNLRKELKELFDISENPIKSDGGGNYKTTFQTSSTLPPPYNDDWESE
jgi:hypothetical protein